jgi:hypothetical protein
MSSERPLAGAIQQRRQELTAEAARAPSLRQRASVLLARAVTLTARHEGRQRFQLGEEAERLEGVASAALRALSEFETKAAPYEQSLAEEVRAARAGNAIIRARAHLATEEELANAFVRDVCGAAPVPRFTDTDKCDCGSLMLLDSVHQQLVCQTCGTQAPFLEAEKGRSGHENDCSVPVYSYRRDKYSATLTSQLRGAVTRTFTDEERDRVAGYLRSKHPSMAVTNYTVPMIKGALGALGVKKYTQRVLMWSEITGIPCPVMSAAEEEWFKRTLRAISNGPWLSGKEGSGGHGRKNLEHTLASMFIFRVGGMLQFRPIFDSRPGRQRKTAMRWVQYFKAVGVECTVGDLLEWKRLERRPWE